MSRLTTFIVLLTCVLLAGATKASSFFKPNCTLPPRHTNFVSGPNTRGTLSILYNCFSIILLCTWSIQHLNVPAGRKRAKTENVSLKRPWWKLWGKKTKEDWQPDFWKTLWWTILDTGKKIKWMFFTILVPEYLVGKALNDIFAVKDALNLLDKNGWEEIHVRLANMGYFILHFDESLDNGGTPTTADVNLDSRDEHSPSSHQESQRSSNNTPLNNMSRQQKGEETVKLWRFGDPTTNVGVDVFHDFSSSQNLNLKRLTGRYWALTAYQWTAVTSTYPNLIGDAPLPDARDLENLDHGGKLVKLLAILQVSYLVVQLIARQVANLPSTQLEITALAFSATSFITYILLLGKPQGIESIQIIEARKVPVCSDVRHIVSNGPSFLWTGYRTKGRPDGILGLIPIPNDAVHQIDIPGRLHSSDLRSILGNHGELISLSFGAVLGGVLFGGVHCLAWNFHFPTSGEAMAWRVCSVLISGIPLLSVLFLYFWMRMNPQIIDSETIRQYKQSQSHSPWRLIVRFVLLVLLGAYILARLFLMVEVFRTLFYLPPDAFIETWSGNFPHFGA